MTRHQSQEAIRAALLVWDQVFAAAWANREANPDGSLDRAETLTRAYMTGWLWESTRDHAETP